MNIITQTPRLIIRNFQAREEAAYLSLFDDERVTLYLPKRSSAENIKIFRDGLSDDTHGNILGRWGIFNAVDNDFMGMCLLRPFDDGSDRIELGYVLGFNYWGKGIATEMAVALISFALQKKPDVEIVAVTDIDNVPSQRVLEKAGMQRDGIYIRGDEDLAFFRFA